MGTDDHRFYFEIGDYPALRVECPYDMNDYSRPCWPHDEDGNRYPSTDCTYESWVENCTWDELLRGNAEVELAVHVTWESDMLVVQLEGVAPPRHVEVELSDPPERLRMGPSVGSTKHIVETEGHFVPGDTRRAIDTEGI